MATTIMQYNACSIKARLIEFKQFLFNLQLKPDVICIQETYLKSSNKFEISGYTVIRKDRSDERRGGGIATLIKTGINYKEYKTETSMECLPIEIGSKVNPLKIINVYIPPTPEIDKKDYVHLFTGNNTVIVGDLNAHHPLWHHTEINKRGKIVEELMEDNNFVILNTGQPTHQKHLGGMNTLDLSIVSQNLSTKCSWHVHNDTIGSDHLPTFTCINHPLCLEDETEPKWNHKKADWSKFNNFCREEYFQESMSTDIDELEKQFNNYIIRAANESIPLIKINPKQSKSVPYWNDLCTKRIKERNKAQNKMNNTQDLSDIINYRKLKAIAQRELKTRSKDYWQQYCDTLNNHTKLGTVWNMTRKMNGITSRRSIPSLQVGNRIAQTNIEKANMLAETFARNSSDTNYSSSFLIYKNECEKDIKFSSDESSIEDQNINLNEDFKMHELISSIRDLKNNSSPGTDKITNEMIKHLPQLGLEKLLQLFNATWKCRKIPSTWQHALILPFAKPNKDATTPENYRPISLTSCLCKLMEKMVTCRLTCHLEKNNLLNENQTGFRKGRGTIEQIMKLQDKILKYNKNKGYTLGVF